MSFTLVYTDEMDKYTAHTQLIHSLHHTHPLTHPLTHSFTLTHTHAHSLTYPPTHSPTQSLITLIPLHVTHPPTHLLTHLQVLSSCQVMFYSTCLVSSVSVTYTAHQELPHCADVPAWRQHLEDLGSIELTAQSVDEVQCRSDEGLVWTEERKRVSATHSNTVSPHLSAGRKYTDSNIRYKLCRYSRLWPYQQ